MAIQLFKPTFHVEECLEEIRECLEKGWTGLGFKTVEFEKAWMDYTGHKNAHYLCSATAGLHEAVKIMKMAYGWKDGDEIISTPVTFVSSNHAIRYENLHVRFADVDEYLCLDPKSVEACINEKTRAVMYVGYGGSYGQLDAIIALCKKHGLKLILDAAHMAGTRVNGVMPGTMEGVDVTVYSFQAVKNLPTADSGMICFDSQEMDKICREMAWLGINKDTYARSGDKGTYKWKYDVEYLGHKDHGNSIMASIALVQLKYLDRDNAYRRQVCTWYDALLADNPNVVRVPVTYPDNCSRHLYVIRVQNRDQVLAQLNEADIYPGVHYTDNTEYAMYSYDHGKCPNAHRITQEIISLPLHMQLSYQDVEYVANTVNKITGK